MRYLRSLFCSLLVCALLFVGFSSSVNAEELENLELDIYHHHYYNGEYFGDLTFTPNNGSTEKKETVKTYSYPLPAKPYNNRLRIVKKNQDILAQADRKTTIKVNNFYFSILAEVMGSDYNFKEYIVKPDSVSATIDYVDGSTESINDERVSFVARKDKIINLTLEFTPPKDVQRIYFKLDINNLASKLPTDGLTHNLTFYSGEYDGDDKYQISVDIASEELGLIETILEFVSSIYDGIVNLPTKLWNLISDGLKSLFVPSDEFIVQFKDDINTLLSQKLGAVYQVVDILMNTWDSIEQSTVTNTIHFPQVSINLPDNAKFEFGGWDIKIVPDGFDILVNGVKMIVGVISTLFFVNGLKRRYDEVMGG